MLALLAPSVALAFRPTDGTDAGVVDRGVVEVQVAATELVAAGGNLVVGGPAAALAVGLGAGWEVGVGGSVQGAGVAVKRRLAGGPDGAGLALEVGGTVGEVGALAPLLAVSVPTGPVTWHLDGGATVDTTGAARGLVLAIVEGPALGPVGPVAQVGWSDGAGGRSANALAGAIVEAGPFAFDGACGVVDDAGARALFARAGVTAVFGPLGPSPVIARDEVADDPHADASSDAADGG